MKPTARSLTLVAAVVSSSCGATTLYQGPMRPENESASALQAGLTSRIGGLGRVGMYGRLSDASAITFGIGFTHLTYDATAGSVDASSFNLWLNTHWAL